MGHPTSRLLVSTRPAIEVAKYKIDSFIRPTSRHLPARIGVQRWQLARTCPYNETNRGFMEKTIIDLNELSALLGRSPDTIKKDLKRNRLAVPPRLHIPGTRLLRWRKADVDSWLASHVEVRSGSSK